jgi:predicted GNAT family acetyltransferase
MSDVPPVSNSVTNNTVTNNEQASRFELTTGGQLAELVYRRRADRLILVHTRVPDPLAGHGLGGHLVRAAVELAAAQGWTVVPACPFARDWLRRHPDDAATVTVDWGDQPAA